MEWSSRNFSRPQVIESSQVVFSPNRYQLQKRVVWRPLTRCFVYEEQREPYENLNSLPFKNLNANIEVIFLTGAVENLNDQKDANTVKIAKFLAAKAWLHGMRGYSAEKIADLRVVLLLVMLGNITVRQFSANNAKY